MQIYDTMTRQKQELQPVDGKTIRIYACGPTVYNFIHIGNARPLCVFDTFRRYLKWRGFDVKFVQNFTDVDDKLIKKANEEGITVPEVAERYIKEFFTDAEGLNIMKADVHPRATENIDGIIKLISTLIEKGYAYESQGDVYFRALKFDEYGKLSHQPIDDLESGARIDVSDIKENPLDFALWKTAKPGEPYWDSPWGKGRPGWHIECSVMAKRYLGDTIDIHCGGQDLIFPHHENEIAQSECANGCEFAHLWMHNGYINVDNRKMSKSLGNFFTVRDVAEKYGYEPIRFLMISSHYRSPINYSTEIIEQSKNALDRLYNCRANLTFAINNGGGESNKSADEFINKRREQFIRVMDDDFNTADGISAVFDLVRDINTFIDSGADKAELEKCLAAFDELCGVLGLVYNVKNDSLDDEVEALIEERTKARAEKNWAKADEIRDKLKEMNIIIEDTPQGIKWHRA